MATIDQATVTEELQAQWRESAQLFADCVSSNCTDIPPHSGHSVVLDLDKCSADSDGPTNYYSGQLTLISDIAGHLGVVIDKTVPAARPRNRRGR